MPTLLVDGLRFDFQSCMAAEKYDESQHYLKVWQNFDGGKKAVDVVAMRIQAAPVTVWLIEAKDFRVMRGPSNIYGLAQDVAKKVNDSLLGLGDAAKRAKIPAEKEHAKRAIAAEQRRIVLHLEPHVGPHSALFPREFGAGVLQKLKQLVRSVDPNPLIASIAKPALDRPRDVRRDVPWAVS
jgi:hypothetical protein